MFILMSCARLRVLIFGAADHRSEARLTGSHKRRSTVNFANFDLEASGCLATFSIVHQHF